MNEANKAIETLKSLGYAVVAIIPEELGSTRPRAVESILTSGVEKSIKDAIRMEKTAQRHAELNPNSLSDESLVSKGYSLLSQGIAVGLNSVDIWCKTEKDLLTWDYVTKGRNPFSDRGTAPAVVLAKTNFVPTSDDIVEWLIQDSIIKFRPKFLDSFGIEAGGELLANQTFLCESARDRCLDELIIGGTFKRGQSISFFDLISATDGDKKVERQIDTSAWIDSRPEEIKEMMASSGIQVQGMISITPADPDEQQSHYPITGQRFTLEVEVRAEESGLEAFIIDGPAEVHNLISDICTSGDCMTDDVFLGDIPNEVGTWSVEVIFYAQNPYTMSNGETCEGEYGLSITSSTQIQKPEFTRPQP